jgi:exopolysaccharide biosynthesis WecB/TagA/CpsF family protein
VKVNILGIKIDNLKKSEVLNKAREFLANSQQHYIVTPNPEMVVATEKDKNFLKILNKADLAVPDGFGLILASHYLGHPILERIQGVDLMIDLCQIAEQKSCSVFLLGAKFSKTKKRGLTDPKEVAAVLRKKFSQLKVSGGVLAKEELDEGLIQEINSKKPEILFVALGAGWQEKLIAKNLSKMPSVKIAMGVGGAFDFIAGKVKRAPNWMRKIGLEWLWRLFMQPWRWKRILTATIKFSWKVLTKGKNMIKKEEIRVRIAPSPTGYLHIGTARTALFNFLFAENQGGKFILRIEDTDLERSDEKFTKEIIESLHWLGINYDEGPDIKGDFGPYRQSERLETYKKYLQQLLDENRAYHCFCTEEGLEAERQEMIKGGEPPVYSGRCANLTAEQVKKFHEEGRKSIIRFRMPNIKIIFDDLIKGVLEFETRLIGDIAIAKNLETPLYNFAVVVDDETMKISHVIRGEDHLSNTPKQIALIEALGFKKPKYAHIPLTLAPDRTKLSKRHGATAIADYRTMGYLPEALINFMEKLNWLNGHYIRQMDLSGLTEKCIPYLENANLIGNVGNGEWKITDSGESIVFDQIKKIIALEQERLVKLSDLPEIVSFFFKKDLAYDKDLLIWKKMEAGETVEHLSQTEKLLKDLDDKKFTKENLEKEIKSLIEKDKLGVGETLWPLRVALTGLKASPPPFDIAEILGKEKTLQRIAAAKNLLNSKNVL